MCLLRLFASLRHKPRVSRAYACDSPTKPSKRQQRLLWLAAQSTVGGAFYRYLRAGKGQLGDTLFSERNLFASASNVDDEWMDMCYNGARDTRGRFATLAYLCGTVPGAGRIAQICCKAWRCLHRFYVVMRSSMPRSALRALSSACPTRPCHLIEGGRAVLPYENALARYLAEFLQANYDKKVMWTSERAVRKVLDTLKD